jgi:hypothetical protein
MSDVKSDPWALLAEARDFVERAAHIFEDDQYYAEAHDTIARIDAALAEHADSATPVVEWCAVGDTWATAYPVDGVEMTVMRWADGPWKWWTKIETSAQGTCSTEAEAKSAAIAAARGLK